MKGGAIRIPDKAVPGGRICLKATIQLGHGRDRARLSRTSDGRAENSVRNVDAAELEVMAFVVSAAA